MDSHSGERYRLLWLSDDQLLGECECDTWRASGPGGQKRNKTESAIRLRHHSSGLAVTCSESRSQATNRRRAVARLREAIALQLRESIVVDSHRPGRLLAELLLFGSLRGRAKQRTPEYLTAIAELLDIFVGHSCSLGATATQVGLSTGKLSRFLRGDERIVRRIGELRRSAGLKPLRWD